MNDEDFQKLVLSVKQMGTLMQGGKLPHRRTTLTDLNVKGRREPEGSAKALLRVVGRNSQAVLSALHE